MIRNKAPWAEGQRAIRQYQMVNKPILLTASFRNTNFLTLSFN